MPADSPTGPHDVGAPPPAHRELLRHLAQNAALPAPRPTDEARDRRRSLDDRSRALVGLGAVVAIGGGPTSCQRAVAAALAAGATANEIVEMLTEVGPTIGLARLVPATGELALALGYDIDHALEGPDDAHSLPP